MDVKYLYYCKNTHKSYEFKHCVDQCILMVEVPEGGTVFDDNAKLQEFRSRPNVQQLAILRQPRKVFTSAHADIAYHVLLRIVRQIKEYISHCPLCGGKGTIDKTGKEGNLGDSGIVVETFTVTMPCHMCAGLRYLLNEPRLGEVIDL